MAVLLGVDERSVRHDPVPGHPEGPGRLDAVLAGIEAAELDDEIVRFDPRTAPADALERVHDTRYLALLERTTARGGGRLDGDTAMGPDSYAIAVRAAGAGLDAIDRLDHGQAAAAFLAVRPPGHHARRAAAMGFCLINSLAVAVAALAARGERVLVVDWDAHHGNGTQEIFYERDDVLFCSLHQYPLYPGSGQVDEVGTRRGRGFTINVPFPAGTAGDAYRVAMDELVVPAAESFSPTWLAVSCGFDAHRADPLTDLGLSAADFGDLTERVQRLAPPGRRLFFLEGGYDPEGLARSAGATVAALGGSRYRPELPTGASPPRAHVGGAAPEHSVTEAVRLHEALTGAVLV